VYASASGASNDKGCKPCPADEDLQTFVEDQYFGDPPENWYNEWSNKDEIIASMLKYSPAGSEGEDSCVANCNYGTYWDGSECSPCPVDTYLGFDTYASPTGTILTTYNENRASPKYGDGTDNEALCIPCPSATIMIPMPPGSVAVTGDTDDDECLAQCQFILPPS